MESWEDEGGSIRRPHQVRLSYSEDCQWVRGICRRCHAERDGEVESVEKWAEDHEEAQ